MRRGVETVVGARAVAAVLAALVLFTCLGCYTYAARLELHRAADGPDSHVDALGDAAVRIASDVAQQNHMIRVRDPATLTDTPLLAHFQGRGAHRHITLKVERSEDGALIYFLISDIATGEETEFVAKLRRGIEERVAEDLPGVAVTHQPTRSREPLFSP